MFNRPFSAISHNYIDETTRTSNPTSMLGQEVLVSQELHRKIFDTLTTSITGHPQIHQNSSGNGMTFTFSSNQPQQQNPQFHQTSPQWQWGQPTNLNWPPNPTPMQQDPYQYQNSMKNEPYHLRFHLDHQTSTSDLPQSSKNCAPDFTNISGCLPDWLRFTPIDRNYRKLILKAPDAKKADANVLETCGCGKNVTFKDQQNEEKKDVNTQASFDCNCGEIQGAKKVDGKTEEVGREPSGSRDSSCDKVRKQKRSRRKKKQRRESSCDSNDSTETDELDEERFRGSPKTQDRDCD